MTGGRVLLVSPFAFLGGAERDLVGLARHLPRFGYRPTAALFADGPLVDALGAVGCEVAVVPAGRIRDVRAGRRTVAALVALARDQEIDLLVGNMSTAHLYSGRAARRLGLPAVLWQQIIPLRDYGGPPMSHRGVERLAGRVRADVAVVLSREAAEAQGAITPRTPVRTVNAGIDVDAVRGAEGAGAALRASTGLGDGPLVGIVGWLERWKGQDVFLRAAAALAARFPDVGFVVVGGPGDMGFERDLHALVTELGLGGRVHFTGHQADPYPWFDALDVLVHASWGEAFGLVLVEAMALGIPVVATDRGGTTEIVVPDETGWLVAPGDPSALADAVAPLLADPALRARVGAAARRRAERFTQAAMAEGMATVFDDVLAAAASGSRLS